MKPRTWPTCWSSSDKNWLSSHADIHPTIQMFISLVTMEPTSLLAHYSAISADHDYTLLEGQPLSQLPDTSWYIPSLPAPPIPFVLGQCILLLSLPSSDGHGSANPQWVIGVGRGCHLQTHRPSAATCTYPLCGCAEQAFWVRLVWGLLTHHCSCHFEAWPASRSMLQATA